MSPKQTNFLHVSGKHVCCKVFPSMPVTRREVSTASSTSRKGETVHSHSNWILCPLFLWLSGFIHKLITGTILYPRDISTFTRNKLEKKKATGRWTHSISKRSWHKGYNHVFHLVTGHPYLAVSDGQPSENSRV